MKKLVLIIVAVTLGYFGYQHKLQSSPNHQAISIQNPTYSEVRIQIDIQGRQIEGVLLGKMKNLEECQERTAQVRNKLIEDCPHCTSSTIDCKSALVPRYAEFFDDVPSTVTYLSANSAAYNERDVRILFWGLTADEGKQVCNLMQNKLNGLYSGQKRCIPAVEL